MSPYITKARRRYYHMAIPGDLTYRLTMLIEAYRYDRGDSFSTFAEIVGALEQTKDEFQRRVIHPYEDRKRAENGDVYA